MIRICGVAKNYPVVSTFKNETNAEMKLYLEMVPEMVILSPGDEIEPLACPSNGVLPISVERVEDGFHIHAYREADPDWQVRYRSLVIKAEHPTRLSDFRQIGD